MENKVRKKKADAVMNSRFYRVYFAVVGVALVCVAIGLVWLNGVVKDYETAQPVHAAEVVAELFEKGDYDRLYDLDTSAGDISGGDRERYVETLRDLTDDCFITWREAFSANADERRYVVLLDGEKLATFTLVPSGETTGHGNRLWKLGSVTTNISVEEPQPAIDLSQAPYRVSAPEGYVVTVDGEALTQANAISVGTSILPEGFLPEGVAPPTMTEYAFNSEGEAPVISAVDPTGAEVEVLPEGENAWTVPLKENEELKAQYSDAIIKLAERVAKYTVKDLSRNAILGNVATDSPAEKIIRKFNNDWAPSHRTATVSDAKVSDFYVLSEDCLTCHVEFTFTLRTRRGNDYVYPTNYTFCIVRKKGKGKLYNLTFN